ncbi:MAG: DUF3501 family protein [Rhodocyclaceae bacterium]|nr:DUF3501 family protein [Rhodocyclaceae bacterium]MBX3669751.1 DUF3501 family protein [Rhodocyclaceae bacterium]
MAVSRDSLMSLEQYARERTAFRAQVLAHKKNRSLALGPNITLAFEDELTVRYQIQEMLRIERVFEEAGIAEELSAYNPLVPDGSNLKATMMIEFPEVDERRRWLGMLKGVEQRVWLQVEGKARVYAIADEDLERENEEKTAAVHFLRFEFTPDMLAALAGGAALSAGVDHAAYEATLSPLPPAVRDALTRDFA